MIHILPTVKLLSMHQNSVQCCCCCFYSNEEASYWIQFIGALNFSVNIPFYWLRVYQLDWNWLVYLIWLAFCHYISWLSIGQYVYCIIWSAINHQKKLACYWPLYKIWHAIINHPMKLKFLLARELEIYPASSI